MRTTVFTAAAALAFAGAVGAPAYAQLQPTTNVVVTAQLNATGTNVNAARLRRPTTDALGNAHIGVVIMHPYSGYQNNTLCNGLAQRGLTTLCLDSTFNNNPDGYYGYEQHAPGIRAGIDYLRGLAASGGLPGISRVLLLGHSMGAPMMAFYQNVAQNGADIACKGPEKVMPCVDTNLQDLPSADGVVLFDPHLGDALAVYTYVDPAFGDAVQSCPARKLQVDMFSPANGYVSNPGALNDNSASYDKQFRKTFFTHQAVRNDTIRDEALRLLAERRAATGNPNDMGDDIPFNVPGTTGARLFQPDTGLMRSTQMPHVLLSRDGTRPVTSISSVRPPSGNADAADCLESTRFMNVHVWLGAKALRGIPGRYNQLENDITGIDYGSSATSSVDGVRGFTQPLLIIANTGHYFLRPAEIVWENSASVDKTVAYSEGAVHGGTACAQCTRIIMNDPAMPTAAANAYWTDPAGNGPLERTLNYMAEWMGARY